MDLKKATIIVGCAALLSACNTTQQAKERSIFVQQPVTAKAYSGDLNACDGYVKKKGASDGEQSGAAVAGLLLGGIVGMAATSSAYSKSQNRLFEECMYGKGYRLIAVPKGMEPESDSETGAFNRRKVALDLIEENKVEELIAWEDAKNSGDPETAAAIPEDLSGQRCRRGSAKTD